MSEKEKKPIYKRWWFWLIIIIFLICLCNPEAFKQGFENGSREQQLKNIINENSTPETSIENAAVKETENTDIYTSNVSENDYIELVTEVFDRYYPDKYIISKDRNNWTIANTLNRTKLKGYVISYDENKLFEIILVFNDKDNYTVETFNVDHTDYIK